MIAVAVAKGQQVWVTARWRKTVYAKTKRGSHHQIYTDCRRFRMQSWHLHIRLYQNCSKWTFVTDVWSSSKFSSWHCYEISAAGVADLFLEWGGLDYKIASRIYWILFLIDFSNGFCTFSLLGPVWCRWLSSAAVLRLVQLLHSRGAGFPGPTCIFYPGSWSHKG